VTKALFGGLLVRYISIRGYLCGWILNGICSISSFAISSLLGPTNWIWKVLPPALKSGLFHQISLRFPVLFDIQSLRFRALAIIVSSSKWQQLRNCLSVGPKRRQLERPIALRLIRVLVEEAIVLSLFSAPGTLVLFPDHLDDGLLFFSIPILIACVVLFFIHRAHVKRVRREEKNDKDFDMDFGIGDLPGTVGGNQGKGPNTANDGRDQYLGVNGQDSNLQPPPGPYLVPKANVSRESLHSLSDPRDNPYGVVFSSPRPPSPGSALSPYSDQHSISGRSTRNLLAPISQIDDQHLNSPFKPSARVPSPLAIPLAIPLQPEELGSSRLSARSTSNASEHSRARTPSVESPTRSSLRGSELSHEKSNRSQTFPLPRNPTSPNFGEESLGGESLQQNQAGVTQQLGHVEIDASPFPASAGNVAPSRDVESRSPMIDRADLRSDAWLTKEELPQHRSQNLQSAMIGKMNDDRGDHFHIQNSSNVDDRFSQADATEDEDHAKRIQSVYQEYWNDSQYYDGSEEWESLPRREIQDQFPQPMPGNNDRREWPESNQEYYDTQYWRQQSDRDYYRNYGYENTQSRRDPVGLGLNEHWEPRPVPPSYYSRPSTSHSTSSIPSRVARTPKPLAPLSDLPAVRYKLDDLASPISFSKPRRFVGSGGSPVIRPASPAQVLSSSWSQLAELPVPHRLRRSGSFSSIEFAPTRKYAASEVDAGDTGSIRSFARTEASLRAVSAGAGRINRLPQALVPMGKASTLTTLRPQNYDDIRYV
jgi:hypothetical protein